MKSNHCLNNSIGGWAPESCLTGIFKSSIKIAPGFSGAYLPLPLLCNFPCIVSWVCLADVCAEKFIIILIYFSPNPFPNTSLILIVFPVPVGPVVITCLLLKANCFITNVFLTLSGVGTIISVYPILCGKSNLPIILIQGTHSFFSGSNIKSYTDSFSGKTNFLSIALDSSNSLKYLLNASLPCSFVVTPNPHTILK